MTGTRSLVEFDIQLERLEIFSVDNISEAEVKFVFRRRMEFHVTNTFLQTFILIGIGFMSLYFDVDNFSDRIMVTLTTMLVIATITASIQAVKSILRAKSRSFKTTAQIFSSLEKACLEKNQGIFKSKLNFFYFHIWHLKRQLIIKVSF